MCRNRTGPARARARATLNHEQTNSPSTTRARLGATNARQPPVPPDVPGLFLFLSCSEAGTDGGAYCNHQMDSLGLITGLGSLLVGLVLSFYVLLVFFSVILIHPVRISVQSICTYGTLPDQNAIRYYQ